MTYKVFPPRWSHIRVPLGSRGAARAAVAMYAPCTPAGLAARNAAWLITATLGARALPGPREDWRPPMAGETWGELVNRWRAHAGAFSHVAVYQRPQKGREGFAVLLIGHRGPLAFARLRRRAGSEAHRERAALKRLTAAHVTAFWHPSVIDHHTAGEWDALLTTALPARLHRPAWGADLATITAEIRRALDGLQRPPDTPETWVPIHGDLTPWNLRHHAGRLTLLDWEDVGWGPRHADEVLFAATAAALRGTTPGPGPPEAVAFWQTRRKRMAGRGPQDLIDVSVGRALQAMAPDVA